MKVFELIELLKTFPTNAYVGKVMLSDDSGLSDSEMKKEDWGLAQNVKNADGTKSKKKIVYCTFGEINEECPCCDGTGKCEGQHYDDLKPCLTCNGSGKLK